MNQRRENNISSAIAFGVVIAIIVALLLFLTTIFVLKDTFFRVTIAILVITTIILILTYITSIIIAIRRCQQIYLCFFDRGNGIAFFAFLILVLGVFILLFTGTTTISLIILKVLISILIGIFAALVYCFSTLIACLINSSIHNNL